MFKHVSQAELSSVIQNVSQKMGVVAAIVEKDYWVCFVLHYLFSHPEWKNVFTFKGGTSLSKCFNLIYRFSEDVDLVLDWRILGYAKDEPWINRSKRGQVQFNIEMNIKAQKFIRTHFLEIMRKDFNEMRITDFEIAIDTSDEMTVLFTYPKMYTLDYLKSQIRLEIGPLAVRSPSEQRNITPYIYDYYPQLFSARSIQVMTVLPERTFWEKATILHQETNRPKRSLMPIRYARHYYDLYCISKSPYKQSALRETELLRNVIHFKSKFYPRSWDNYEEVTFKTLRLVPIESRLKEVEADYKEMTEMFFGIAPSFKEMMETITELENEIHALER